MRTAIDKGSFEANIGFCQFQNPAKPTVSGIVSTAGTVLSVGNAWHDGTDGSRKLYCPRSIVRTSSEPLITCSVLALTRTELSVTCTDLSSACKDLVIICTVPDITSNLLYITCTTVRITCTVLYTTYTVPAITCTEPQITCTELRKTCTVPSGTCTVLTQSCCELQGTTLPGLSPCSAQPWITMTCPGLGAKPPRGFAASQVLFN